MPSLYTFSEYSPEWPQRFADEARRLQTLLAGELVAIHHIGSTSVPGLAAKSVIDLLPLVRDLATIDELTPILESAGYRSWGEYGLPGRRYFTRDHDGYRTHNIHVYQADDPGFERHLALPAYLRSHEAECREYEALKREVFARHPSDMAAYTAGKNDWIQRIEPIAVAWYRQHISSGT